MFYGLMPEIKMDWIGLDWIMSDNARDVQMWTKGIKQRITDKMPLRLNVTFIISNEDWT